MESTQPVSLADFLTERLIELRVELVELAKEGKRWRWDPLAIDSIKEDIERTEYQIRRVESRLNKLGSITVND